ncbi:MAG: type II toxin-antitoxin system Phd/YefM family antitoxin [Dehalococcoidia bacterium]
MKTIPVARASEDLERLIDEVSEQNEPVQIAGERTEAILVSAHDWRALQETLYLNSMPEVKESILEGMKTPIEECVDEPEW